MNGILGGSLPVAASELAQTWDTLYVFLYYVCVFFFAIVCAAMIIFAIKYRARPGHKAEHITHNDALEFIWTAIPTVLVVGIFIWGWVVFRQMYSIVPTDAMEVKVVGQQWSWTFQYDDGRTLTNQLYVPKGKPVKLLITSKINDVLHSFFIPNLRIKRDAVPGMYTTMWFNANVVGQHQIFCTEYCGTGHSEMLAKLIVLDDDQWSLWKYGAKIELPPMIGVGGVSIEDWKAGVEGKRLQLDGNKLSSPDDGKKSPANVSIAMLALQGKKITQDKGCVACHSDDGSKKIGPSYQGLFGSEVELSDGTKIKADENYIRESIFKPQVKIVKGFENMMMPPYVGQIDDTEMSAVIEYIKSVK
ncbi:MAG: cytochrome c oxidase subunit 2 [Bacteriovoracaceae bacterium]|nr:cytochrome c oxidase subunit 2 [Bacteriovoracaceae bacterium]